METRKDTGLESITKKQLMSKIAVYKASAQLLSSRIITARPDVDINGADLLAIMKVLDGAKFARIQCKGRTLRDLKASARIDVQKSYVTGTFTLLLYIHCPYDSSEHLFCFFPHDIRTRNDLWKSDARRYRLSVYGGSFRTKLDLFYFDDSRVKALTEIIEASDMNKEFHYVFGKANIVMPV